MKHTNPATAALLGAFLLSFSSPAAAQEERGRDDPIRQRVAALLERFDKDADGALTQAEAGESWERIASADADKDGKVSAKEMVVAWSGEGGGERGGDDGVRLRVKDLLERFDKDGDRALTQAEAGDVWVHLAPVDANKDGKVTADEMIAAWSKDRGGEGAGSDPLRERIGGLLREYDLDKDGALTQAEAGKLWERIAPADADKDGKVTAREMYTAWSREKEEDAGSEQSRLEEMIREVAALVEAGKLPPEEGKARIEAYKRELAEKKAAADKKAIEAVTLRIRAAVESGRITPEQGKQRLEAFKRELAEKAKQKGAL